VINVRSGQVRDQQQVVKTYQGDIDDQPSGAEAKLFARLSEQCADQLVNNMFAKRKTVDVVLADADNHSSEIRKAVQLSRQGRWAEASQAWQDILAANPDNHAVRYNLGLTYEARQQYREALGHYQAALASNDNEAYRRTLGRVTANEHRYLVAMRDRIHQPVPDQSVRLVSTMSTDNRPIAKRDPNYPTRLPVVR
ncbi:MAG: hypothetical protein N2C12_18900, partial [Planctomycetales bacterium]